MVAQDLDPRWLELGVTTALFIELKTSPIHLPEAKNTIQICISWNNRQLFFLNALFKEFNFLKHIFIQNQRKTYNNGVLLIHPK